MKKQSTNTLSIKVGDTITFTNSVNYKVVILISRVEEKSWYDGLGLRSSYGTLNSYTKYPDFKITRA